MPNESATAQAPVSEADVRAALLFDKVVAAIRQIDHFPTTHEIAANVISSGFETPEGMGIAYVAGKVARLVESGELDDVLRSSAQQNRPLVRRKPLHDKNGYVKMEDKLGRKGHRELRYGLILRNGRGWRVCGKTTKDLTDAQREAIYQMRRHGASWGEITKEKNLEYNHGMTARNIFLAVQRAKQR